MKNKGWHHASVVVQQRNSPVSEQICLSSSWWGNFAPVIAPPSSPQLLLISTSQFPPLCRRRVVTYFRHPLRRGRSRKGGAETENCRALGDILLPVSPRHGSADSGRRICPNMMLWLRSLPHKLHICLPLVCLSYI